MSIWDYISDHTIMLLAIVVGIEAIICGFLVDWGFRLKASLRAATAAAEEAARTAALAAPGGLDPEIVIQLLRSGHPVTLDSVRRLTEQQFEEEEAMRHQALANAPRRGRP